MWSFNVFDVNREEHPMMNYVILENLLHVLSFAEVSNFRLVCRHWNDIALPVWLRKGPPITLKAPERLFKYLQEVHDDDDSSADDSDSDSGHGGEGLLRGLKKYPKFELLSTEEKEEGQEEEPYPTQLFEQFWNFCGPWLTHLKLNNLTFPDAATFENILVCQFTPNLVALELEAPKVSGLDKSDSLLHSWIPQERRGTKLRELKFVIKPGSLDLLSIVNWKALLSHHSNLTDLAMTRISPGPPILDPILGAITEIRRNDKTKLELKCLKCLVNGNLPKSFPQALLATQLKLEDLQIIVDSGSPEGLIHEVLPLYSKTLTKLGLYIFESLRTSPFAGLSQLQQLILAGYPMRNLLFLNDLPNLRVLKLGRFSPAGPPPGNIIAATQAELEVVGDDGCGGGEAAPIILSFPSMRVFECQYCVEWTTEDIIRLAGWMPNLTHLGIVLEAVTFRQVCHSLPGLMHLAVFTSEDERNSPSDQWILSTGVDEEDNVSLQPIITSLQNLKSFEITHLPWRHSTLSDAFSTDSVLHGILRLSSLEKLVIKVEKMNDQVKELILSKLPFAKIYTKGSAEDSSVE